MDACLAAGVNYMDTANYETDRRGQVRIPLAMGLSGALQGRRAYRAAGLGLRSRRHRRFSRPGSGSISSTRSATLDILDCNGGDHGQHFATNFNPEINIREVTAPARHWLKTANGSKTPALTIRQTFDFEAVGPKNMYLMYHEELESLAHHLPEVERIRFWMTFGDAYLTHLSVLQNVGMTRIDPVIYNGPRNHPAAVPEGRCSLSLPVPGPDAPRARPTSAMIATGLKDGSGEDLLHLQHLRPRGRLRREPATRRSATPPASPR